MGVLDEGERVFRGIFRGRLGAVVVAREAGELVKGDIGGGADFLIGQIARRISGGAGRRQGRVGLIPEGVRGAFVFRVEKGEVFARVRRRRVHRGVVVVQIRLRDIGDRPIGELGVGRAQIGFPAASSQEIVEGGDVMLLFEGIVEIAIEAELVIGEIRQGLAPRANRAS